MKRLRLFQIKDERALLLSRFSRFIFNTRRYYRVFFLVLGISLKLFVLKSTTDLTHFIVGLILVMAGETFRVISAGYLHGRHTVTTIEADFLNTSGPYAYMRNPLYVGNFMVDFGICIVFNVWFFYPLYIAEFILLYTIIIPYEEKFLKDRFGKDFDNYKDATWAIVPKFRKYKSSHRVKPDFKASLRSEFALICLLTGVFFLLYFLFVRENPLVIF
ncbi:MAG: isoprenylcysteine carboxylmethyltransferase family protein [Candidatus Aminicenantes bacterium]|jgi:protein-S-isoprenylcysteine O-methyltransferase Ste14